MNVARLLPLAALGIAAAASAPPSPTPSPAVIGVERVEVRLAQFDVVVRDKAGKLVAGLGVPDFRVVEDGVPLEIVAVDEHGLEAPATAVATPPPSPEPIAGAPSAGGPTEPPAPPDDRRSFVLVFDALGDSTALRMNQAKNAAQRFVRSHVGPRDLVAVYQLDLYLRALGGLSSNVDDSAKAIGKVAWRPGSTLQDDISESVLAYSSTGNNSVAKQRLEGQSALAASELDWRRDHTYESLDGLATLFEGLPGRRILVLVSPGFPMSTNADLKLQTGGFTPKFRSLIRSMAKLGVTVYALDIGSDLAIGDAGEKIDWRVVAGKFGMDENVLTDLGLEHGLGTGSASSRREFLGFLAAETGGRLLTSTDPNRDFESIQEESTRFYRIACKVPVTTSGDRYRRTTIRTTREGLTVMSRRGRYSDVTPLETTKRTATEAATALPSFRPLASRGVAVALPAADPRKIPIAVVVEALGPVDLSADASGAAALNVEFHLVARVAGEIVDRYDRSFTARVRREGVEAIKRALRIEGRLTLPPGIYELQGVVRLEDAKQLATWRETIAVPPLPSGAHLALAGAFLMSDSASQSPLLSGPQIPADQDPLVLKSGVRVLPATLPEFDAGSALFAVFWLRGVPLENGKPRADLTIDVVDDAGAVAKAPSDILLFASEPSGGYRVLARLDARALAPGAFSVRIRAKTGADDPSPAQRTLPFTLVGASPAAGPSTSTGVSSSSSP